MGGALRDVTKVNQSIAIRLEIITPSFLLLFTLLLYTILTFFCYYSAKIISILKHLHSGVTRFGSFERLVAFPLSGKILSHFLCWPEAAALNRKVMTKRPSSDSSH